MIYLKNNTEQQMISIPRTTVLTDSATTQFATEAYVQEAISGLCKVTAVTEEQYTQLQTKDPNTIYGIIDE